MMEQKTLTNSSKSNGNGGGRGVNEIQLPIGFRFRPTDEELLRHYLKPKVYSSPFPASVIPVLPHHTIYHSHPSHLPGDPKERRHFFCKRKLESYVKSGGINKRILRIASSDGSGYWKVIGKEKLIQINVAPGLSTAAPLVAIKKSMAFYQGKPFHGVRTPWIMHEYRLLISAHNQELENWVVCRISQRKRKPKNNGSSGRNMEEVVVIRPNSSENVRNDFFISIPPSPSCSSGSSSSSTPFSS